MAFVSVHFACSLCMHLFAHLMCKVLVHMKGKEKGGQK